MILSTGLANAEEIEEAIDAARGGCKGLAILHCVSGYPAPPDYNLQTISDMVQRFGLVAGLWIAAGITTAVASVALGA